MANELKRKAIGNSSARKLEKIDKQLTGRGLSHAQSEVKMVKTSVKLVNELR